MKTPTFNSTVDILVKAYLNGTLLHGNCAACAVGNIIAHNRGYEVCDGYWKEGEFIGQQPAWSAVFETWNNKTKFIPTAYHGRAQEDIESSGYSLGDLMKIEKAFETGERNCSVYDGD